MHGEKTNRVRKTRKLSQRAVRELMGLAPKPRLTTARTGLVQICMCLNVADLDVIDQAAQLANQSRSAFLVACALTSIQLGKTK